jgi:hypothetical protein
MPCIALELDMVGTQHCAAGLVAEQPNHAEELADGHHEHRRVHQPQGRRQHRQAGANGAEDTVERPRDDHVQGDDHHQTGDPESEEPGGGRDVGDSRRCVALGEEAVDDHDVAKDRDDSHQKERDPGGEAGGAHGPCPREALLSGLRRLAHI